jgi:hypothetical protein
MGSGGKLIDERDQLTGQVKSLGTGIEKLTDQS